MGYPIRHAGAAALLAAALSGCLAKQEAMENDLGKVSNDMQHVGERLSRVEGRVKKLGDDLERIDRSTGQSRADQSVMVEDLKIENKNLQGALEVLRHDLDQALQDNKKLREDFDYRISDLERKLAGAEPAAAPVARGGDAPATTGGSDAARYAQAMATFKTKRAYAQAAAQFKSVAQDFPKGKLAASAQFWAGESYFAQKKYTEAIREYQVVVDKYPQHDKACDAVYKQGLAFVELKKPANAQDFLQEALERCRSAEMKKKVQTQLKRLSAPAKPAR